MAKKQKPQPAELPAMVFVTRERDGNESYLVASETTVNMDSGDIVGVYKLTATRTLQLTRKLV